MYIHLCICMHAHASFSKAISYMYIVYMYIAQYGMCGRVGKVNGGTYKPSIPW